MDNLIAQSDELIDRVRTKYVRENIKMLEGQSRLIGIKGSRGVGKTTLMLQYLKLHPELKALYISMDDLYFADHKLFQMASDLAKRGWTHLMIDEVHLYPEWSKEIKLIYDRLPDLKVVFTGSSLISLDQGKGDLSRRAQMHVLYGFSYREYLKVTQGMDLPVLELKETLNNHREISRELRKQFKPLEFFSAYLKQGYYPFFMEDPEFYLQKLKNSAQLVLDMDLPHTAHVEVRNIHRLKQLLSIIAESVPFIPNIHKLSERLQLDRNSLKLYLHYLHDAMLIYNLYSGQKGISQLTKPQKIYLQNPNLFYALSYSPPNSGSLRESFLLSQLSPRHRVNYPKAGDFLIDDSFIFEVGGLNKTRKQLKEIADSWLIKDNIETGFGKEIPLWLFGLLY